MEIGVREVLIIVVGLIILGILVDGFRRALQSHKNSLKVNIKKPSKEDLDDDLFSDYNPELPGGSARVVRESRLPAQSEKPFSASFTTDTVPEDTVVSKGETEPSFVETPQPDLFDDISTDEKPLVNNGAFLTREENDLVQEEFNETEAVSPSRPVKEKKTNTPAQDVIAINLFSKQNLIDGEELLKVVLNNGLRFGEMGLFHRLDSLADEEGGKLFSLVNMVKPGSFDVDAMAELQTPGICLFLTLPGPRAPRGAFETMLETAQRIASALDCEMRDENQSALTQQTIAHYRQRIDDFCRKQMAKTQQFDLVE